MPETRIETALDRATAEVLDRMFFTSPVKDAPEAPLAPPWLAVAMRFEGEVCGTLALAITRDAARTLAADFLGAASDGELEPAEVAETVRELANMICGSTLSALGPKQAFRLSRPEMLETSRLPMRSPPAASTWAWARSRWRSRCEAGHDRAAEDPGAVSPHAGDCHQLPGARRTRGGG